MNAIQLLREMHADTKVRFKLILAADDPSAALEQWRALQPLLDLHERLEDELVYTPVADESGSGTPLGDWDLQHESDVALVKQLIASVDEADAKTPDWRMRVARVMDALSRHVMDEEGLIFGRIEQLWGPARLETVGAQLQQSLQASRPAAAGNGSARRSPKREAAASARRRK
jgi:hypothetical protein